MNAIMLTPVYNGADVLPKFLKAASELKPKPIFHLFVTNNCTDGSNDIIDEYLESQLGERISWNYPKDFTKRMGTPYAGLAIARQRLFLEVRDMMNGRPTITHALFTDDDTIILDEDALEVATNWNEDLLGGSYMRYFPEGLYLCAKWMRGGKPFFIKDIVAPLMHPYVTSAGFMLLSRSLVMDERLNWFPIFDDRPQPHPPSADDFGFCIGARKLGYQVTLDGIIHLEHLWRARDRPWWCDPKTKEYMEFEYK